MTTVEQLKETFSDNFVNSYRAHSCHFNITGPEFYGYHKLLQKIYEDSETIQDDLGELIRAMEETAPETISEIMELADLEEQIAYDSANHMLRLVLEGQEHMIGSYYKLNDVAEIENHCDVSNFAQDRIRKHKKFAWQLRSILE